MLPTNKHFIFRLKMSFILFIITVCFVSYFKFSFTNEIVINEKGNISGIFNKLRYKLQKDDFLINQKELIINRIEELKQEPERLEKLNVALKEIEDNANEFMANLEEKYPTMKSSEVELYIDGLRNRADKLEDIEFEKVFEEYRLENISELERILLNLKRMNQ